MEGSWGSPWWEKEVEVEGTGALKRELEKMG